MGSAVTVQQRLPGRHAVVLVAVCLLCGTNLPELLRLHRPQTQRQLANAAEPVAAAQTERLAQVQALRSIEPHLGLDKLYVMGTNCVDNGPRQGLQTFLQAASSSPDTVQHYEFMQAGPPQAPCCGYSTRIRVRAADRAPERGQHVLLSPSRRACRQGMRLCLAAWA